MEEKVILILKFGLELLYTSIGLTVLFGGKIKKSWIMAISYIGFALLVCGSNIQSPNLMMNKLGVIGWLLIYLLCFIVVTKDNKKNLKWLFLRLLVLSYLDELVGMFVRNILYFCNVNIIPYRLDLYIYMLNVVIITLIAVILSRCTESFLEFKIVSFIRKSMIPLLSFLVLEIICLILCINALIEKDKELHHHLAGRGLGFISMISIGIFVLIVLYIKKSNETMEYMLVIENQMQDFQKSYYEMLLEKEAATRKYRHDMNGHLVCLNRLANDNDMESVKEYIKEMNDSMEEIRSLSYSTGIQIFDVLLNHYATQLPQETEVRINGRCDGIIDVSNAEQCMIFSNLIKNAVEAISHVNKLPYYLNISIVHGREYVKITIVNPLNEKNLCVDSDGKIQTSKEDKENHGIGLQNVKSAIDRNKGRLNYVIGQHEFSCEIILPMRQQIDRMLG